jgi:hypothetical protein
VEVFKQKVAPLPMPKRAPINGQCIEALAGFEKVEADAAYLDAPTGTGIELPQHRTPGGRGPLSPFGPESARELDPD